MAGEVNYTEDCLRLNVWTSSSQGCLDKFPSPVLVWIHGGGFSYGSASYDNYTGSILAAKTGLVIVSMNYRLGALGFLDANLPEAPGNVGLMDQALALRWIRDNAAVFGGDQSSVTLFGHSAGALSVHAHMLSPMSKGLFIRAVMLSGVMYTVDSYESPSHSLRKAEHLAALTGCLDGQRNVTLHPTEVIKCLKEKSAGELVKATSEADPPNAFAFLPTYHNDFLPKEPKIAVDAGFASHQSAMGNNVFSYVYDYSDASSDLPSWIRAPHRAELAFLFGLPQMDIHDVADEDLAMSDALTEILASFAKFGCPNHPHKRDWPKYSEDQPVTVVIAPGNYSDIRDYRKRECDYWNEFLRDDGRLSERLD
ncbi:hypothetical protein HPB52_020574 [Rhipicephalus sanguineus]|uniref:Carboxylic ester hydrolase n=1 Tax=Rhipicephalus sanguineus TaxID=34632 RepID=A0A9D4TBM7_RHISA|nr:hypothetical protein HPB52_020574 [Rhipicephalus sanguineus]